MRIAIAQRNPTVGNLPANAALALEAANDARQAGAHVLLLSELFLTGYPPRDLLTRDHFMQDVTSVAHALAKEIQGITLLVGSPWPHDESDLSRGIHNSILVIRDGKITDRYDKQLLPSYDIFDEERYFLPGRESLIIEIQGVRIGLSICEDLWHGKDAGTSPRYRHRLDPIETLARQGAQIILNSSASPFGLGKDRIQRATLREHCASHNIVMAQVNQLGANDDQIYHGIACVFVPDKSSPTGTTLIAAGKPFKEDLFCFEYPVASPPTALEDPLLKMPLEQQLFESLVLGVRDYFHKTSHTRAVLGLSGGIDSALTACIATAALGAENLITLSMPSRYSSQGSRDDAATLAKTLGVPLLDMPINDMHSAAQDSLKTSLQQACTHIHQRDVPALTDENIQSRLRGLSVMSIANAINALALVTGNKSEFAVGYATLYGDMSGGLAVLADVTKTRIYALSHWLNEHHALAGFATPPIPPATLTKPPSAELRPDQTDQDTLPPYDELDAILERYVEQTQDPDTIESLTNLPRATIDRVVQLIDRNEFKRQQAPIGLKVTRVAFGCGRRHPVAQRYQPGCVFTPARDAPKSASPARR
jgi:NAD+ synthase (glutamine-hydrolysing)